MMIDPKRMEEIEQAVADMGQGFNTGDATRRYAKDVNDLLGEIRNLKIRNLKMELVRRDGVARADVAELKAQMLAASERADLWQRDCEAAQLRVRELELRFTYAWPVGTKCIHGNIIQPEGSPGCEECMALGTAGGVTGPPEAMTLTAEMLAGETGEQ